MNQKLLIARSRFLYLELIPVAAIGVKYMFYVQQPHKLKGNEVELVNEY